jgi:hypothetical protein
MPSTLDATHFPEPLVLFLRTLNHPQNQLQSASGRTTRAPLLPVRTRTVHHPRPIHLTHSFPMPLPHMPHCLHLPQVLSPHHLHLPKKMSHLPLFLHTVSTPQIQQEWRIRSNIWLQSANGSHFNAPLTLLGTRTHHHPRHVHPAHSSLSS